MSMDFRRLLAILLVTTTWVVVLSVCIGVGGCSCPIALRACRVGIDSLQLMNRSPSSTSAAEEINALMIWEMVTTAPLFAVMADSFDMKNGHMSGFLLLILRGRRRRYGTIGP